MPRSRPTSGRSDYTPAADAPTFQPPGRHEVGPGGRRVPGRTRILAPSTEPVCGEAANRNKAGEKRGHGHGGHARPTDLGSPSGGRRPLGGRRLAAAGCGDEPEPLSGSGDSLRAPPCGGHPRRRADAGLCLIRSPAGARMRVGGGSWGLSMRRDGGGDLLCVAGSGALRTFRLVCGHLRRGTLGGCGLGVRVDFRTRLGGRSSGW
jgi:hypothetical protein